MRTDQPHIRPCACPTPEARSAGDAKLARAADGRRFAIRRMSREDRPLLEAGLAGLSPRSRYMRFHSPLPKLSSRLVDQLMDFDGDRHVAYAALTPDRGTLVGVARYVRLEEDRVAEVSIGIADEWQRAGVGALLLNRLIGHARRAGIESLVAVTLSGNRPARALAQHAGFAADGAGGGYSSHRLELPGRLPRAAGGRRLDGEERPLGGTAA